MRRQSRLQRARGAFRARAVALAVLLAALGHAGPSHAQLRPLVREMLTNLALVNQVGEGVALEDYDRVTSAAAQLAERARALQSFEITQLGIDVQRDAQFDAYLAAQQQAADIIAAAAKRKDGHAVILGLQQLFGNGCLACHSDFRERENLLRPSVLFMTTLLNAWQDINRGLAVKDYALIARRAREMEAVGRVFSWDQVIEATFGIAEAKPRQEFRTFLHRLTAQAARIETAAVEEKTQEVVEASGRLWEDGCLPCHARFRKPR